MKIKFSKAILRTVVSVSMLVAAGVAVAGTTTVNLTAQRMTATLPPTAAEPLGATVPMWGYCDGSIGANADLSSPAGNTTTVACGSSWANGPTITVPAGSDLVINLNNALPVSTSIVVLGQIGGGLGSPQKNLNMPQHLGQTQTTWPGNGDASFTPPPQLARVSSFATEVAAAGTSTLGWTNLKAGTYIYTTGTTPSLQAPMGLYGVLVVTQAPIPASAANSTLFVPGKAYPGKSNEAAYDSDVALMFSEIDPVQNKAVDAAAMDNALLTKRFDDPSCSPSGKCYPAAVNYRPTYFLINGKSFDQTTPAGSAFAIPATYSSGNVLVRLLNAGLRTHIPAIVGLPMAIVAEDGNVAPGNPKVQNEVLLTAGKTHDVLVKPAAASGAYTSAAFPLFDRQLSLSAANQLNAGMQGFLRVAGGALPSATTPALVTPTAVADMFPVPLNASVNGNVRTNDIAVTNAAAVSQPASGSLSFYSDGSFVYTPNAHFTGADSFTYNGNNGTTNTVTVTLNVGTASTGASAPNAILDAYTSKVSSRFSVARPGVLGNDSDPGNLALTAALASPGDCGSVSLDPSGAFTATKGLGASCQFTYKAVNSKNTASADTTVTVTFPTPSGITVTVTDPSGTAITDYRWIIQEDLTFKADPSGTPSLSTRTIGTSFHRSHMTVVASGCVGDNSCGLGQAVRTVAAATQTPVLPGEVALESGKNYYISILPGDAGDGGHAMGGAYIVGGQPSVAINSNAYAWEPSQLSVFIYEDNAPVNNQNDLNENGLGGFNIILMDAAGRSGDVAGQQTFDAYGMPLSNWLLGRTGCPDILNKNTNGTAINPNGNVVGAVYTCPNDPNEGTAQADPAKYALAGHALIKNLTPARYDVIAHPAADRQGKGEVWWQVETLEGTPAQDAFNGVKEPRYFQEFGPPGFHTTIGFVNPDRVKQYAVKNGLVGTRSITGRITNQHMSRPSNVQQWDSGSYDMLSSTTCQVALNSQAGDGPAIAIAQCDREGNFVLSKVPNGDYEIAIWDQWLDQIIQFQSVTVADADVALGNIPVLSWFTQYDQNIFQDLNKNGVYDAGEPGISNVTMTTRYRDGGISNQTATDSSGNGLLAELFPLFNWYVTEADTTRFKQTGVNVIVDAGGPVDTSGDGKGLWNSMYQATPANPIGCDPTGGLINTLGAGCPAANTSNRVEIPGAYSYGLQGFISQRSTINWGRTPYVQGENGGIQGTVVYSTTRPFDDQRYNVQTLWEPLVPRVTVNLYRKEKLADGTETLTLVDTTKTSSFDDYVNAVGADGKQVNMQCPGQRPDDPFFKYTLNGTDQFRCYDGWHNWNQVQPAPYDGRYQFPSAAYVAAHPLTAVQQAAGQTLVSLPPGQYVVETVTPPGYEVVKEEDKNILNGDAFVAPATTQFAGIGNVFILPDQATLNNDNPYNLKTADGIRNNATTNLGVTSSWLTFPECVGDLHRVPDYLSLFPGGGLVAPFAGMDRPLCDRKLVSLNDQAQSSATFFVFTQVPAAAAGAGIILDDASSEFNAAAPDFGEKASVPFVPVSIKDFLGREIGRSYSDQWGAYNVMTPSSWLVNPPTPSGYGPNMLITCINDPGPISVGGKMVTDPQYNPAYSNFCYTLPFMPGRTTYLDTPVVPIAAFASGYNQADCDYPDATPAISRVDSTAGFGPYLTKAGGTLTITALGDVQVQNPGYAGPFADPNNPANNPAAKRTITRHYGFGTQGAGSKVTLGGIVLPVTAWSDVSISVTVPANTATGELVITADNGKSSVDTVTVTVEDKAPTRVAGASGQTIQAAIEAATPGDLILVDAGTYNELVIMWKPVRLQGVGAASVIINAAKYPTSKLDVWRPAINSLFAVNADTGLQTGTAQVDPLPTQEITGGVVLLEPSVLGTEEGAGITVLAKNLPASQCANGAASTYGKPVTDSNFNCAASRIDGVSVTGGDAGGGIYVNGWAHGLEISNNRVYGNAGSLHGGIRVGVPYLQVEALPTNNQGNVIGFGYDNNIKIHHNAVTKNGTVEGPAGAGGAGGGVSICTGTDGYSIDHNWICGNFGSSDGGGIGHLGFSQGGSITKNSILFNQSFQQTTSAHGGGIAVRGEPAIAGTLTLGTGNLTIDSNLIRGNFAESGSGGGIRLEQVNGADVALSSSPSNWFKVTVTNNMIENNVAAYAGGGISLADTLQSTIFNNTVASNDSVGIAGTLLAAANGDATTTGTGIPSPAGIATELTSAQLANALPSNASRTANKVSQPSGFVNNIVWKNRSFFYKVVGGNATLCSSNNAADAASAICNTLRDQITTGQCVQTTATADPAYWDIGVVGDRTPVPTLLPGAPVTIASAVQYSLFGTHFVVVTTAAPHGFLTGQSITISGFSGTNASRYNGAHVIVDIPAILQPLLPNLDLTTMFVYAPTSNGNATLPALAAGTATPPGTVVALTPTYSVLTSITGYTGAGLTQADPLLADIYCNGSRVTPEYTSVINPPSVKNLQVAATVDEGNNYVNLRYGPLSLAKPTDANGTAFASFGDLHLNAGSPAINMGTVVALNHDYDGDGRPQGTAYDIGADERPGPQADLVVTKTDGQAVALRNETLTYTIVVSNLGPNAVTGAAVTDTLPGSAFLNVTGWTCVATAGDSCTATGTGNATRAGTVTLASGGSATYTLTGTVSATATVGGFMTNTVNVAVPAGLTDPNSANNTAVDTDTIVNPSGTLSPSPVALGSQIVGSTSGATGLTFTNTTGAPLQLRSGTSTTLTNANGPAVGLTGTNPTNFAIATVGTTCTNGATIPVGGNCTINVTFSPAATGPRTATLNLYAAGATVSFITDNLSGTGVAASASFSPVSLSFGVQPLNTTSAPQTLTLTNTAGASITLRSGTSGTLNNANGPAVGLTSTNAANYAIVTAGTTCTNGATIAAGGSCTINVTFTPTATGTRTATVNVYAAGATGAFVTAPLTGTGGQAAVGFSWTNGGTVGQWGTASGARTITVTNTGLAPLTLTAVPVVAGAQFSLVSTTCSSGQVIAAAGNCTVTVNRTRPTSGITIGVGSLTINDTGALLNTQILPLTGS